MGSHLSIFQHHSQHIWLSTCSSSACPTGFKGLSWLWNQTLQAKGQQRDPRGLTPKSVSALPGLSIHPLQWLSKAIPYFTLRAAEICYFTADRASPFQLHLFFLQVRCLFSQNTDSDTQWDRNTHMEIEIHWETHKQRHCESQTETHTERHTHSETYTYRETHTYRLWNRYTHNERDTYTERDTKTLRERHTHNLEEETHTLSNIHRHYERDPLHWFRHTMIQTHTQWESHTHRDAQSPLNYKIRQL